mmetsp:Transcript_48579/g.115674  ORF Transcript_48579/g.115674 Transcript_48579/m.115674 type:complete len:240 (+) Transcript_48579:76-795(+)
MGSVQLEIEFGLGDAGRINQEDLSVISGVNVPLPNGGKHVLGQLHDACLVERGGLDGLVPLVDLRIQYAHDQSTAAATGGEGHTLEAADGIIVIYRPLALIINPAEHVEGVVREEALVVQGCREHLCDGSHGRLPPVLVFIHDQTGLQVLVEGNGIGLHAARSNHTLVGQLGHLAAVACVDAVSLAESRVRSHHHKVFACNAQAGATVVGVRAPTHLHGGLHCALFRVPVPVPFEPARA